MEQIVSKIDGRHLHSVIRVSDVHSAIHVSDVTVCPNNHTLAYSRANHSYPDRHLQIAQIEAVAEVEFAPHYHVQKPSEDHVTEEAWVVIRGHVAVSYFDTDGSFLKTRVLEAGDCTITYRGGHAYSMAPGSLIYEFKTGPYRDADRDKVML